MILKTIWERLCKWAVGWWHGGPHFIVGPPSRPYLWRWYMLPRNPLCNVYLHKFLRDDDDRALHDHPWVSMSLVLKNGYVEQTAAGRKYHAPGSVILRRADYDHRIELVDGKPAWSLFVTGPVVRTWGFHCPRGWVSWQEFTKPGAVGEVGRGCGEP